MPRLWFMLWSYYYDDVGTRSLLIKQKKPTEFKLDQLHEVSLFQAFFHDLRFD